MSKEPAKKRRLSAKALTLESIFEHCEEVGECLIWKGRTANGSPQIHAGNDNRPRYIQVRRFVFEQSSGEPLGANLHPVMTCRDPKCVSFGHMKPMTTKQISRLAAKEGRCSSLQKNAAIAAGRRRSCAVKLNIEIARAIRASDEPGPVLAARYGVNRSLIPRIRAGLAWREQALGASVFNLGAVAANDSTMARRRV